MYPQLNTKNSSGVHFRLGLTRQKFNKNLGYRIRNNYNYFRYDILNFD